jgi:hypothetical protein
MVRKVLLLSVMFGIILSAVFAVSSTRQLTTKGRLAPMTKASQEQPLLSGQSTTPFAMRQSTMQEEYHHDFDLLESLRYSHNLEGVIAEADQLELKWRSLDGNLYSLIVDEVCNALANSRYDDPRRTSLAEKYARLALSHTDKFSWLREADLVGWFGYERSTADDALWAQERSEKAKFWLHAWQRFENEFDSTYDEKDRRNWPLLRVTPPVETGLPSGVAPEAIADPKLRAEYKQAIRENDAKAQRVAQQNPLHMRKNSFLQSAEKALVGMYSQPPSDIEGLKNLLETYIKDQKARELILSEVANNMSGA